MRLTYHQERLYSRQVTVFVSQGCPRPSMRDHDEMYQLPRRFQLCPATRQNKKVVRMYVSIVTEQETPITVSVISQRQEGVAVRKDESFDPLDYFDPSKNVESVSLKDNLLRQNNAIHNLIKRAMLQMLVRQMVLEGSEKVKQERQLRRTTKYAADKVRLNIRNASSFAKQKTTKARESKVVRELSIAHAQACKQA